jgi:hypothetical protein
MKYSPHLVAFHNLFEVNTFINCTYLQVQGSAMLYGMECAEMQVLQYIS